jgi:Zn-dependent protease with chaperone function
MLAFRRILAAICYIAMLAADAAAAFVIYESVNGGITYYLGLLIFVPVFIFTYWMSTFFSQLSCGRVNGVRIMPKWARTLLGWISNIISLALVAFWGYIYVTQSMYNSTDEALEEVKKITLYL